MNDCCLHVISREVISGAIGQWPDDCFWSFILNVNTLSIVSVNSRLQNYGALNFVHCFLERPVVIVDGSFCAALVSGVCVGKNSISFWNGRRSYRSTWIAVCEKNIPCCAAELPRRTEHTGSYYSQCVIVNRENRKR